MTLRYAGPGGSDTNDGLSWATRKLTLSSVEATPVVAGDTVYVAPGTYREMLTVGVSGTAGNPITYIGDVTGEHTDGIGGVVRITGSNNDTTTTRVNCIAATSKDYRTFQGFTFDMTTTSSVVATTSNYWTIRDCTFSELGSLGQYGITFTNSTLTDTTVQRCVFLGHNGINFNYPSVAGAMTSVVVANCNFISGNRGINFTGESGGLVKNCLFTGQTQIGIYAGSLASGTDTVNNCVFTGVGGIALQAGVVGFLTSDYNTLWSNGGNYSSVTAGTNDLLDPAGLALPILAPGIKLPAPMLGELAPWSPIKAIAGTGEATDDLFGVARPVTSTKKSWGAIQYQGGARSTAQYQAGAASMVLADAGRVQFKVPVTAVSTAFSVYVYREASYAGTNPQMVIKQPGQSDTTVTDTGAAGAWNQLTTTLTPAATPGWVIIEVVSSNTATTGSYSVYVDTLAVT